VSGHQRCGAEASQPSAPPVSTTWEDIEAESRGIQARPAGAAGPVKVTVAMHAGFQADARLRWAGVDPDELADSVADEIAERFPHRRARLRPAREVAKVLAILDQLGEEAR
jgi:hypothetical protein